MDQIRKRSTVSAECLTVSSGAIETSTSRSPINKRKRANKTKQLSGFSRQNLPILLSIVSVVIFLLHSIYRLVATAPSGKMPTTQTLDRILFHDIPKQLRVPRGQVAHYYLPQRPRMLGNYFATASSDSYIGTELIDVNAYRLHKTYTTIEVSENAAKAQEHLLDSKDYENEAADPFEKGDCVAQYDWQKRSVPTCNHIMEQDLTNFQLDTGDESVRLLAHGYWRDVWKVKDTKDLVVMKTMRWQHDFVDRNYDRHRRDAVAMEQLTSSQWVMNIYGFCGNSGLFEFADGGSLDDSLFAEDDKSWSPSEKLVVAFQVASGIAAMHNHHKEGVAAMAHTDITTSQFVYVGSTGIYKLNDFNRCRFLRWNKKTNKACTYHVGNNPGTFRAPEEYKYEGQSEKVDVYSMGNIFYAILTGLYPFDDVSKSRKVQDLVMKGIRPPISKQILNTTDPFERILLNATLECWIQDPNERASARKIQKYFEKQLVELGVQKS